MAENDVLWLVDVETEESQCLHIRLLTHDDKSIVNIICSEYECISGHRSSGYIGKLRNQSESVIEIIEKQGCDVMAALELMHSDSSSLDCSRCSALTYTRTAVALSISYLMQITYNLAEEVLDYYNSASTLDLNAPDIMSVWDAIAILSMIDSDDNASPLLNINFKGWMHRFPEIFCDETLFSSCRNIFSDSQYALFFRDLLECHQRQQDNIQAEYYRDNATLISHFTSLAADTEILMSQLIGKFVMDKALLINKCKEFGKIVGVCNDKSFPRFKIQWQLSGSITSLKISKIADYIMVDGNNKLANKKT